MIIISIDTDSKGKICVKGNDKRCFIYDIPVRIENKIRHGRKIESLVIDSARLESLLSDLRSMYPKSICILEKQVGVSGQSSSAMFTFASNYGKIIACCEIVFGKDIEYITAAKWKRFFGLTKQSKSSSKRKVLELVKSGDIEVSGRITIPASDSILIGLGWQRIQKNLETEKVGNV